MRKTLWSGRNGRRHRRKAVWLPAGIDFEDGLGLLPCKILDVSDGGARLLVADPERVPETFTLCFSARVKRKCLLAWRKEMEVGVRYV
jgi:hypothetical protein